jgi:hypothetical protein
LGRGGGGHSRFNLRHPPARLLAMICLNIAPSALALMGSPLRNATVRAVLVAFVRPDPDRLPAVLNGFPWSNTVLAPLVQGQPLRPE